MMDPQVFLQSREGSAGWNHCLNNTSVSKYSWKQHDIFAQGPCIDAMPVTGMMGSAPTSVPLCRTPSCHRGYPGGRLRLRSKDHCQPACQLERVSFLFSCHFKFMEKHKSAIFLASYRIHISYSSGELVTKTHT